MQAEAEQASIEQMNTVKKLSIVINSITYKYIHIHLLKILHHLVKKKKRLTAMPWREFVKKNIDTPHRIFTREEWLIWQVMALTVPTIWITLPGPAEWWVDYSEKNFQKYWDMPTGTHFKEVVELAHTLFTNPKPSENAAEVVEKIQVLWKICK